MAYYVTMHDTAMINRCHRCLNFRDMIFSPLNAVKCSFRMLIRDFPVQQPLSLTYRQGSHSRRDLEEGVHV